MGLREIDEVTGLPVPPEGYIWKVSSGGGLFNTGKHVTVRLGRYEDKEVYRGRRLERVAWYLPKVAVDVYETKRVFEAIAFAERSVYATPVVIANLAFEALEKWEAVESHKALLGDYPPKTINNEEDTNAG